jgi:hypothetical protein
MIAIKITETKSLKINEIQSFVASEVRRSSDTETVLTITHNDGEVAVLQGAPADEALSILRQHGF